MNTRSTAKDELLSLDHNLEATLRRNKKKQQGLFETDLGGEASSSIPAFESATPPPSPPPSPPQQPPVMAEQTLRQSTAITAAAIAPSCKVYLEPAEGKD